MVLSNMINKQAKLSAEDLKQIAHIEVSIQHWSMEHTNLSMQAYSMLENIHSLHEARTQILEKAYKEAGIDSRTIQQPIKINKDGIINCVCTDPIKSIQSDESEKAG